jgi:hypothetical protein
MLEVAQRKEIEKLYRSAIDFAGAKAATMKLLLDGMNIEINPDDEKESKTRPYGFDVHRAKRELIEDKAFMQYLCDVATDGAKALAWCEQHNIPVIAILPESVWASVCKQAELFTLWPNEHGKVPVSRDAQDEFIRKAEHNVRETTLLGWRKEYDRIKLDRSIAAKKAAEHYFYKRKKKALMLELFPDFVSSPGRYNTAWVDVRFPTPDADFGKALLALQKHHMNVGIVVEADAIDVSKYADAVVEYYENQILTTREKISRDRKEMVRSFFFPDPDPILTTTFGKVRIVIAQYGNWPLELTAIKTAIEADLRMKN